MVFLQKNVYAIRLILKLILKNYTGRSIKRFMHLEDYDRF